MQSRRIHVCHDDIKWRRISHLQGQTQETVHLLKMVLFILCSLCFRPTREKKSSLVVWWFSSWFVSVCSGCQSSKVILVWRVSNFSLQSQDTRLGLHVIRKTCLRELEEWSLQRNCYNSVETKNYYKHLWDTRWAFVRNLRKSLVIFRNLWKLSENVWKRYSPGLWTTFGESSEIFGNC